MFVIAILISDLHLSESPPVARSAEPDWFEAQDRPLRQVKELMEKHDCVCIAAGDIFDRWFSSPAVINWAIEHLPRMYAVPGQHDLPMHRLEDVKRSAYWTLVEAGRVVDLGDGKRNGIYHGNMLICGFPWGSEIEPLEVETWGSKSSCSASIRLAVAHSFLWSDRKTGYPGAPAEARLGNRMGELKGYTSAVFGDNHKPFMGWADETCVLNCGCLIRRKQDERGQQPSVGLLYDDGRIERRILDVSRDRWSDAVEVPGKTGIDGEGLDEFLAELKGIEVGSEDFRGAVRRYVEDNDVGAGVKRSVLKAMGD